MKTTFDIPAGKLTKPPTPREAAAKWVAQTFYGEMLRQMRSSPFGTEWASGGRAGEAYQGMLDLRLAEGLTNGPGKELVESITRRIAGRAYQQATQSKQSQPAEPAVHAIQQDNPYRNIKINVDPAI